jgi:hypothetical protein
MTVKEKSPWYVGRRSAILARLFLEDLGAKGIAPIHGEDVGFDCFATFESPDGSTKSIAVEVKAIEEELKAPPSIRISPRDVEHWSGSNVPVLVLVIDVKHNRTYFNWARVILEANRGANVPVTKRHMAAPLRESTAEEIVQLKQEIQDA